ncbi:MAG: alpha/beta fold hydrolase [Acidimicrobiia bacterium]|nr:alpha/beta fold hydrolase [Acidimicrobiia bacterium]
MRLTVDDGTEIEVLDVAGPARAPALLLVHGFGGAKEDFGDHLEALARTHRVVTFDHRGHGQSGAPADPASYTLDRLVDDVLAVADALGINAFRLLGHSMGGMVARRLVLAHPDRVEALVLMGTGPGAVPDLDRAGVEIAGVVALDQGMGALKALLDEHAPLESPAGRRLREERPGYQEFADRKLLAMAPVAWATLILEIQDQPDQLADLVRVTCPTLVVVGEQDGAFLGPSRAMADRIPGASLVVVPDAGHSPQFENPSVWWEAVDGFLHRAAAAVGGR